MPVIKMELENHLKQIGLTGKEVRIYFVVLEAKEATLPYIVKQIRIPRSTVESILNNPRMKNLVAIVPKKSGNIYIAKDPGLILNMLNYRKDQLEQLIVEGQNIVEQLASIQQKSSLVPRLRYFQGKREIQQIYDEILDAPIDEIKYISNIPSVIHVVGEKFLANWSRQRAEKKIKSYSLRMGEGELIDPQFSENSELQRQVRIAPAWFESPCHIMIYGDNVALITTHKENFGSVITSRDYALTMRSAFKVLWGLGTKPKVKEMGKK